MIPAWERSAGLADVWVNLSLVALGIAIAAGIAAWLKRRER